MTSTTKPTSTTSNTIMMDTVYQIGPTRIHILSRELVLPFAQPVLTGTLCISPGPLRRIHCIQSKNYQIVRLGHSVFQWHCDSGDGIWNMTWILLYMTTDDKRSATPMGYLWENEVFAVPRRFRSEPVGTGWIPIGNFGSHQQTQILL